MGLYLLTRGEYSDYGVMALVSRSKDITDVELDAAYKQADAEYWQKHRAAVAAFVARTKYDGPQSGMAFSALWVASPEYRALTHVPNGIHGLVAQKLGATVVDFLEVHCDI